MKKLVISILLVNLLAACASEKPKEPVAETKPAPVAETPKPAEPAPVAAPAVNTAPAAAAVATAPADPLKDPNSILANRSVHYPFNISKVQDADKSLLEAHAKYLHDHSSVKVRLEGNCDERGSAEYNLALGQRRADGVKEFLLNNGVKASQIETVSYGETKPKSACHDESCWKENRHTDLNYNYMGQ